MGYSFCYENVNTSNTVGDDVVIATALVLEDRGENFHIVQNFEVEAQPREDNCLPESRSDLMQCCVSRTLVDPFEVDLQLYSLVIPELQNGPYMIKTHGSAGRGYQFYSTQYTEPQNDMLMKFSLGIGHGATPSPQQMKMFQFVIGKFRIRFCKHLPIPDHNFISTMLDNSTSNTLPTDDTVVTTPTADRPTLTDTPPTDDTVMTPTADTDATSSSTPPTPPTSTEFTTVSLHLSRLLISVTLAGGVVSSDVLLILSFQNSTEPLTPAPVTSLVVGVSVGLVILVMVILLIVAAIILILMVMKTRNKDYVLQQSTESHNIVYTGSWIMQAASCSLYVHVHLYDLICKHAVSISWTSVHIAGGPTGKKIILGMMNDQGTRLYILGMRLYVLNQGYTHGGSAGYELFMQRLCSCLCVQSYHSTAALPWYHRKFCHQEIIYGST